MLLALGTTAKEKPCYRTALIATGYTDPLTGVTTYKEATTVTETVDRVLSTIISCSGSGSNACPDCPESGSVIPYTPFELGKYSDLAQYAAAEIANGNLTGSKSELWVNATTLQTQIFTVEWVADSPTGTSSMVTYIVTVP